MAINQINKGCIHHVCDVAKNKANIRAVSFNFHTPYPDTVDLALNIDEKRQFCDKTSELIDIGYPPVTSVL
ncbi:MAG: radical protein [Bacillales bacterium]|jgi:hypothetical protein|nr:radical protein [Bacillales bacterium]